MIKEEYYACFRFMHNYKVAVIDIYFTVKRYDNGSVYVRVVTCMFYNFLRVFSYDCNYSFDDYESMFLDIFKNIDDDVNWLDREKLYFLISPGATFFTLNKYLLEALI